MELDPINAKRNFSDIVDELIQYFTVKTCVRVKITKEGDFLLFYWRKEEKIRRIQEKIGRIQEKIGRIQEKIGRIQEKILSLHGL